MEFRQLERSSPNKSGIGQRTISPTSDKVTGTRGHLPPTHHARHDLGQGLAGKKQKKKKKKKKTPHPGNGPHKSIDTSKAEGA